LERGKDKQVHGHLGYLGNGGRVHLGERRERENEGILNLNSRLIKGRVTLERTTS